jgi:3-phosphoshikimate 1-carboxyvinyltransferase
MKTFTVQGAGRALRGELDVPGDKSIGHRAVLFAGLAQGRSVLRNLSGGQDNGRTATALRALGVDVAATPDGAVEVLGRGLRLRPAAGPIECGNSGTTMRLLCGVLAAQPFASLLRGDVYLHARPMRRVVEPLAAMGAQVRGAAGARPGEIYPPLEIGPAAPLHGIRWQNAIASAQVKSAILLCGLLADGDTEVVEPVRSRDHTERMLRHQGAPLTVADLEGEGGGAVSRLQTAGWGRALAPLSIEVPGDLSSAAFLLGAALLVPGSRVLVRGVGINPTRTGVLDVFSQMAPGCVRVLSPREQGGEPVADLEAVSPAGDSAVLRPVAIRGALSVRALDELPLLAALCGAAEGESVIEDAAELRVKESDRIAASCALLRAFGVECEERPDGLRVLGRGRGGLRLGTAAVESFGDHRIAMAAAVLALGGQGPAGALIRDVDNVATSYPGFAGALRALGAEIEERG